ncbi:hypothetical protein PQR34_45825, partial [Paraburkholderia sediminicola]|uniref:hypothetical protein n=1 Tax=Paraburkholderia sediminicola TaxID=458836 RepID=UPI0038BBB662
MESGTYKERQGAEYQALSNGTMRDMGAASWNRNRLISTAPGRIIRPVTGSTYSASSTRHVLIWRHHIQFLPGGNYADDIDRITVVIQFDIWSRESEISCGSRHECAK